MQGWQLQMHLDMKSGHANSMRVIEKCARSIPLGAESLSPKLGAVSNLNLDDMSGRLEDALKLLKGSTTQGVSRTPPPDS